MPRRLAIAIHDVSPRTLAASQQLARMVEDVAGASVRLTLLVIPQHHHGHSIETQNSFRRWVDTRIASGDEIALHGLWHRDEGAPPRSVAQWWRRRVLTNREGEFSALDQDTARTRIERGLTLFARCGWTPAGFVPPAWQLSAAARSVLREYPLMYFTTRTAIVCARELWKYESPALSLSARSKARRQLSVWWADHWMRRHATSPSLRFALHPIDASYPETRRVWLSCVQAALHDSSPVTKSMLLERN